MKLGDAGNVVTETHYLDDDSAWDKIRVDLLQRTSIDHDGSFVKSIFKVSREAPFELADAYR